MSIGLIHCLTLSSIIFSLGMYCVIDQKHIFKILTGILFLFSACTLNFTAFAAFMPHLDGSIAAVLTLIIAAQEIILGICLSLAFTGSHKSLNVDINEENDEDSYKQEQNV